MKHINDIDEKKIEQLSALYRKSNESDSIHERNAAGIAFLKYLEKLGLTYDEWLGNKHTMIKLRIKLHHKKLFYHSLWVVFGKAYWENYSFVYSRYGNIVKTEFEVFGPLQLVAEFQQYFAFHSDNYDKESELFMVAYIHAQDMYGPSLRGEEDKPDKPMTPDELQRARAIGHMSQVITKKYKKYING